MPTAFAPMVAAEVWRDYPDYRALSVVARNFHPGGRAPVIDRLPPMPIEELMRAREELVLGLKTMCPAVETATSLLQPPA